MSDGYVVIDVETTGLRHCRHHRVVEVAIVHVDRVGVVTDEWCTLINPQRSVGPKRIHGITAADVLHAPTFGQIAAAVVERLAGRVVVAHNLVFDAMHLAAEFDRLGVTTPLRQARGVCTMRWARSFLPDGTGRSLRRCCQAAGLRVEQAHSALYDARAAAGLLAYYLAAVGSREPWSNLFAAPVPSWPAFLPSTSAPMRRSVAVASDRGPTVPDLGTAG